MKPTHLACSPKHKHTTPLIKHVPDSIFKCTGMAYHFVFQIEYCDFGNIRRRVRAILVDIVSDRGGR